MWIHIDNKNNIRLDRTTILLVPEFKELIDYYGWEMFWFIIFMYWYKSPFAQLPEERRKHKSLVLAYHHKPDSTDTIQWNNPILENAIKEFCECQHEKYDLEYRLYFTYTQKLREADEYLSCLQITDKNSSKIKRICEGIKELNDLQEQARQAIIGKIGKEEKEQESRLSFVMKKMRESTNFNNQ